MIREDLESIICCFNLEYDQHVVLESVQLSCGHYMCSKCIPNNLDNRTIKCMKCHNTNKSPLKYEERILRVDILIQENIEYLMKYTSERLHSKLSDLEKYFIDSNESIGVRANFIKEEIQIRVESLKIELDKLEEKLMIEIDKVVEKQNKTNAETEKKINVQQYKYNLEMLDHNIEKKENFTSQTLFEHQSKLQELQKALNELKSSQSILTFEVNSLRLNENAIGKLRCKGMIHDDMEIINKIKNKHFTTLNIGNITDMCALADGNLLITDQFTETLRLYNDKFELIKIIDSIEGQKVIPVGIECGGDDIYIVDSNSKIVIKTDINFNLLCHTSYGMTRFFPCRLCYCNDLIYVTDWYNRRIHIFKSDYLKLEGSYLFDYSVWYIKIINNTACVRDRNLNALYFYSLPGFVLRHKYDDRSGIIGALNDCFYEYDIRAKKFYCYRNDGYLIENFEFNCEDVHQIEIKDIGAIVGYNSKLILGTKLNLYSI